MVLCTDWELANRLKMYPFECLDTVFRHLRKVPLGGGETMEMA